MSSTKIAGRRLWCVALMGFAVCGCEAQTEQTEPDAERVGWTSPALVGYVRESSTPVADDTLSRSLGGIEADAEGNAMVIFRQYAADGMHVATNRYTPESGWGQATHIDAAAPLHSVNGEVRPLIKLRADGHAFALWSSYKDRAGFDVVIRPYDPANGWGQTAVVPNQTAPEMDGLTVGASGEAVALWRDFDSSFVRPRIRRFTDAGGWQDPHIVSEHTSYGAEMVSDREGNLIVAWIDKTPYEDEYRVMAQHLGTAGSSQEVMISPAPAVGIGNGPSWISLAGSPRGDATVAWIERRTSVWAARYEAETGWAEAAPLEGAFAGDGIHRPTTCMSEQVAFVAWPHEETLNVAAWGVADAGWTSLSPPALPPEYEVGWITQPRCALDRDGTLTLVAIVVWREAPQDAQDPTSEKPPAEPTDWAASVYAYRYANGQWAEPVRIGLGPPGYDQTPRITLDATGGAIVAWEHDDGEVAVWASHYQPSP